MALRTFLKSPPFWLVIAAACIVPASLNSFTAYLNSRVNGRTTWVEVIFASGLWLIFGALTPIPYFLARRFPLRRDHIVRTLSAHLAGALLFSLIWTSAGVMLSYPLVRRLQQVPFLRYYASSVLTNLALCVFLYFAVLGCVYAFSYYREARERESQQARLAAQLAEARLSALRMQLNPHFLFNSLNAITVLVRDRNTQDASRMLELLSGVLRQVLQSDKRKEVTLDEELKFIEKYLTIEQVRFSDRLRVLWSVEPDVRDALVPEFILQPLVENAIRHGIAKLSEAGEIKITARPCDGSLVLSVEDNGPGYHPVSNVGVGLENTTARLANLFGERGQLRVMSAEGGGTVATLQLPLKRVTDG